MKILFLDIDGVILPRRVYNMPGQTKPTVSHFDPGVVGMLNLLGAKGWTFVVHSSWLRTSLLPGITGMETQKHMISQGLKEEYFHADWAAKWRFSGTRWMAIADWLDEHPEVEDYRILDDEPIPTAYGYDYGLDKTKVIQTDFDEGLTFRQYAALAGDVFGYVD